MEQTWQTGQAERTTGSVPTRTRRVRLRQVQEVRLIVLMLTILAMLGAGFTLGRLSGAISATDAAAAPALPYVALSVTCTNLHMGGASSVCLSTRAGLYYKVEIEQTQQMAPPLLQASGIMPSDGEIILRFVLPKGQPHDRIHVVASAASSADGTQGMVTTTEMYIPI